MDSSGTGFARWRRGNRVEGRESFRTRGPLVLVLTWLSCVSTALGHGGLHEQILRMNERLREAPGDGSLYLRRAELHRLHRDFEAAWKDLDSADQFGGNEAESTLCRARIRFDQEQWAAVEETLAPLRAPAKVKKNAEILRAKALGKLGRWGEAAAAYVRGIELHSDPAPDLYLELSQCYLQHRDPTPHKALLALEDGLRRLGPIASLEQRAVELEIRLEQFDRALQRVDRLRAQATRQERWLAWRAGILLAAGRTPEAQHDYARALSAIENLSARQRHTRAVQSLESQVRTALQLIQIENPP